MDDLDDLARASQSSPRYPARFEPPRPVRLVDVTIGAAVKFGAWATLAGFLMLLIFYGLRIVWMLLMDRIAGTRTL